MNPLRYVSFVVVVTANVQRENCLFVVKEAFQISTNCINFTNYIRWTSYNEMNVFIMTIIV